MLGAQDDNVVVMPALSVMPAKAGIQLIDFRLRENDGLATRMTVWVRE